MKIQELIGEIFRRRLAVIDDCLDVEGEEDRRVWEDIQVSDLGNWVRGNSWGKGKQEEERAWGSDVRCNGGRY